MPDALPVHRLIRIALFLFFILIVDVSVWGQAVTTTTIDRGSGGNTGRYTSQAIVNGYPAVAYFNLTDTSLMFARNSSMDGTGSWSIVTVDANAGDSPSLTVVNGNPAISYFDRGNRNLKYVRADDASGTSWSTPAVVVTPTGNYGVGFRPLLALINGNPAISYLSRDLPSDRVDLKFVRAKDANGTAWGTPVSVDTYVGFSSSLAVVDGNPAMSYTDVEGNLKFVRATDASGNSWGTPAFVFPFANDANATSLAVVDGNPAISYGEGSNLKYVRALDATGTSWGTPVVLDTVGGAPSSLVVVNGNPAISYSYDGLKFVRANDASGTIWALPIVLDAVGDVGGYSSLAIVSGNPAISYYDGTKGDLKYLRANDASGTVWEAGRVADSGFESGQVGYFTSQAVVNGNPAISYYDATNGDLKYVRANDATGASWGTPISPDTGGDVGYTTSLALVDGNPAISYYDATNRDLKYVRATDAIGTSWGSPVGVDTMGDVGLYASLAIVDGNPAISYYDQTNGDLKYVRANDAIGMSWGAPVAVDRTGNVGAFTSMMVVNGNPAISYLGKYVRANDTIGATWGTPISFETSPGPEGPNTSLAIVNGNPAISYQGKDGALTYVRGNDASGTSWGTPVTIDRRGPSSSLAVISGIPSISYYDSFSSLNLKYVQAKDASGTSWGAPVTIDNSSLETGLYTSLVELNGKAAISYFNKANLDLKWATFAPVGAQALNISTRDQVKGGENVLIGGFIINGVETKSVIIRAIGPSIAAQGTLQDPVLELRGANGLLIKENDNWKDTQKQLIAQSTLAPKDDRESAIIIALNPGSYTMVLSGKNGAEGIAIVEAYDLGQTAPSQLANISSRGLVQTGDNVMIGGFILGGESFDSRIAIRGLGPSLTTAGVNNALPDPTLDLRDNNGTRIEFNDNYGDNPAGAAELAANGLLPKDSHEAAIFRTLSPGTYTVILAGKEGATGVGLVEVYNLR